MASSPSPSLRLELMATGDQSGTWGDTTNTNLGTLLEQAITGYLSVAQGDVANLTLTTTNYATDQARNAVIEVTGALTATRNVVVQTAEKLYTIKNSTTGGFSIVAKTSGGTGISIPPGASIDCYSDGTNVVAAANYWNGSIGGAVYLDAGAAVGPDFDLFRDSTSPAISDILGRVSFNGRDSAGNKQEYGAIESVIVSPTSTAESGALDFYVPLAGARTKVVSVAGTGVAVTASNTTGAIVVDTGSLSAAIGLRITNTEAGAANSGNIQLYRNSASPASNDGLSFIQFRGNSSTGVERVYGSVNTIIGSPTNTVETGVLVLGASKAGANTQYLLVGANAAATATADAIGLPLGQLSFPGTQNPSTDVNTLDDYEEGTWQPVISFGGSSTGVTYGAQLGTYVKIGQLVFVAFQLTLTNNGSGTGAAVIGNLPFTSAATYYGTIPSSYWASLSAVVGNPTGYVSPSSTTITLTMSGATGTAAMTDTNIPNTADMIFGGCYRAAA